MHPTLRLLVLVLVLMLVLPCLSQAGRPCSTTTYHGGLGHSRITWPCGPMAAPRLPDSCGLLATAYQRVVCRWYLRACTVLVQQCRRGVCSGVPLAKQCMAHWPPCMCMRELERAETSDVSCLVIMPPCTEPLRLLKPVLKLVSACCAEAPWSCGQHNVMQASWTIATAYFRLCLAAVATFNGISYFKKSLTTVNC